MVKQNLIDKGIRKYLSEWSDFHSVAFNYICINESHNTQIGKTKKRALRFIQRALRFS